MTEKSDMDRIVFVFRQESADQYWFSRILSFRYGIHIAHSVYEALNFAQMVNDNKAIRSIILAEEIFRDEILPLKEEHIKSQPIFIFDRELNIKDLGNKVIFGFYDLLFGTDAFVKLSKAGG